MASFQKRGDSWRAIVRLKGVSDSASFPKKSEATAWASRREAEIIAGVRGQIPDKTFGQLLEKYRDEVSPGKDGARWETVRINRIVKGNADKGTEPDPISFIRLPVINQSHFSTWRDRRLQQVSPASVRREWTLLSAACTTAINEWKWLIIHPMKGVKRPKASEPRDRRISAEEIERILFCAGYERNAPPCTMTARVGSIFLFALETGMRAGEICALQWKDVHIGLRYCSAKGETIGARKTAAAKRNVALSSESIRLIEQIEGERDGPVFMMSSTQSLDTLFRKVRDKAAIKDLHFHDTRHEAITRLSKKMDVLALARMLGHRNINELQTYYNESATDIAAMLD